MVTTAKDLETSPSRYLEWINTKMPNWVNIGASAWKADIAKTAAKHDRNSDKSLGRVDSWATAVKNELMYSTCYTKLVAGHLGANGTREVQEGEVRVSIAVAVSQLFAEKSTAILSREEGKPRKTKKPRAPLPAPKESQPDDDPLLLSWDGHDRFERNTIPRS